MKPAIWTLALIVLSAGARAQAPENPQRGSADNFPAQGEEEALETPGNAAFGNDAAAEEAPPTPQAGAQPDAPPADPVADDRPAPDAPADPVIPAPDDPQPAAELEPEAAALPELDEKLALLLDDARQHVADDETLAGLEITGGQIVENRYADDLDLRLRARGGTIAQRVSLRSYLEARLHDDWLPWLVRDAVAVVYDDPPTDAELAVPVPMNPTEELAIRSLLDALRDRIESEEALGGLFVPSATLLKREDGTGRLLELDGRAVRDDQVPLLSETLVEVMAASELWSELREEIFVSVVKVGVVPTSLELAQRYYVMGMAAYWDGNFAVAKEAFTRAIAEDPSSRVLRYWKIVTLLANGETAAAELRLRPLLYADPSGQYAPVIATELWRVQGTVRWTLVALEKSILLTLDRTEMEAAVSSTGSDYFPAVTP